MMVRAGVMPCLARILVHLALLQLVAANAFNFTQKGMSAVWVPALIFSWDKSDCGDGQYMSSTNNCTDCLDHNEVCKKESGEKPCCKSLYLDCESYNKDEYRCECQDNMSWEEGECMKKVDYDNRMQFMTAAQVALGAALVIAVSALSALTCKMCSSYCRSRRRLAEVRRQESDAASLNSVQRFVLQRLRDRPPRYDENSAMPDKPPAYSEISATLPSPSVPQTNLHRLLRAHRRPVNPPAYTPAVGESSSIASFPQPSTSSDNFTTIIMQPPDASGNVEPPENNTNQELPEYTENSTNDQELTVEIPVIVSEVSDIIPEVTCPEISECSEDSPVFIVEVPDNTPLTLPEENTVTGVLNPAFSSSELHI